MSTQIQFRSLLPILPFVLALPMFACGGNPDGDASSISDDLHGPTRGAACPRKIDPASLIPALPKGVEDQRTDAFFTSEHPLRTTVCLKSGAPMALPYQAYVVDAMNIGGTADVSVLNEVLEGTGYVPVTTDGKRGFIHLWIMQYKDTSVGAYNEFALSIDVAPSATNVPLTNACTPILTGSTALAFSQELILDQKLPLEAGRENSGLDKRAGHIEVDDEADARSFSVHDADGRLILKGSAPYSIDGVAAGAECLAGAFGVPVSALASFPSESKVTMVNRDVENPGHVLASELFFKSSSNAFVNVVATPDLTFGKTNDLGQLLGRMNFTPLAVTLDPAMELALDLPGLNLPTAQ